MITAYLMYLFIQSGVPAMLTVALGIILAFVLMYTVPIAAVLLGYSALWLIHAIFGEKH